MITKHCIETAYSFFHQKERIYAYSTLDWQKDDIEYAIADFVGNMSPELYETLSNNRTDFLRDHCHFAEDIKLAIEQLESMLPH